MKAFKSLENRGILLKGTTTKVYILSFPRSLTTTGSPLMKNAPTPLARSVLVPSGLSATISAADAAIQKNIRYNSNNKFK